MRLLSILLMVTLAANLSGQFEQQLSVNLSAGAFKTVGPSDYLPQGVTNLEDSDPTLLPNFKPGVSFSAGVQYNLSRHFSIEASFGMMVSSYWYYDYSDAGSEPYNFLYYEIFTDTVNQILQENGDNELFLTAMHLGLAPRYYFRPGQKINPYLFAGFNISFLDVHFENHELQALKELGREDEYETNPAEIWHDYSTNLGFHAGIGAEYSLGEKVGIFMQSRYLFAALGESDYGGQSEHTNFGSLEFHLGVRVSFLKSRDL